MGSDSYRVTNIAISPLGWSVPIVTDAVGFEYLQVLNSKTPPYAILTMLHLHVWTCLIEEDKPAALHARRQLLAVANDSGISPKIIEKIDRNIFDALSAVISRKPRKIGSKYDVQTSALYEIAMSIGEHRALV